VLEHFVERGQSIRGDDRAETAALETKLQQPGGIGFVFGDDNESLTLHG